MRKVRVGSIRHITLVKGDVKYLNKNEILISKAEGYTILQQKNSDGKTETYVVMPLKDFKKDGDSNRQEVQES